MANPGGKGGFQKGRSGNPAGRKAGQITVATQMRREVEKHGIEILQKQAALAKVGSPFAAKLILDRIMPVPKSSPIAEPVDLAGMSPVQKAEKICDLLAAGRLSLDEAAALLSAVRACQDIKDGAETADRLKEIEAQLARLTAGGNP